MVPTAALNDHVTPVSAVPVTVAVNCWVWEAVRADESGVKEMLTDDVDVAGSARANRQNHTRIPTRYGVLTGLGRQKAALISVKNLDLGPDPGNERSIDFMTIAIPIWLSAATGKLIRPPLACYIVAIPTAALPRQPGMRRLRVRWACELSGEQSTRRRWAIRLRCKSAAPVARLRLARQHSAAGQRRKPVAAHLVGWFLHSCWRMDFRARFRRIFATPF